MNYKIIRISENNYQDIYNYIDKKKIQNLNFDDYYNYFFENSFVYSNSFSREMTILGNESMDIISNDHILQFKWAQKYSPEILDKEDRFIYKKILIKQIEFYKPNVLFFQHKSSLSNEELEQIKEKVKSIKLIAYHNGIPLDFKLIKNIDVIFAAIPSLYNLYKDQNSRVELCYHYFDQNILKKLTSTKKKHNLTFCGTLGRDDSTHSIRAKYLKFLKKKTDIKVFGNKKINQENFFLKRLYKIFPNLSKKYFGLNYFKFLSESKMVFNCHTNEAQNNSGNLRMFEVAGVGSCLITEEFNNLPDLFEKDNEVITYKTIEECLEKIKYLMNNENMIKDVSIRAQKKTLKNHSAAVRIAQIDDTIQKIL